MTTPVVRNVKKAFPDAEIHFLTKPGFVQLIKPNPYIDQIHQLEKDFKSMIKKLKAQKFDLIIDLHKNLRTTRIKLALRTKAISFNKKNFAKYWLVRRKKTRQSIGHIVDRYYQTIEKIGIKPDGEGLDFFLKKEAESEAKSILEEKQFQDKKNVLAVAIGATYFTKRWPPGHFREALNALNRPVILLGGKDSGEEANEIMEGLKVPYLDAVGKYSIPASAALMKTCTAVLTHDTGFMHIAAAFEMTVYSLWGNTVPAFGMTPFQTKHLILENTAAKCRPCSKIGYHECPLGHFQCMNELAPSTVVKAIKADSQ